MRDMVEELAGEEDISSFWLCSVPVEYADFIFPLMEKKPGLAFGMAENLICREEHHKYVEKLAKPLFAILQDAGKDLKWRLEAAFTLLRLGIDPLEKQK